MRRDVRLTKPQVHALFFLAKHDGRAISRVPRCARALERRNYVTRGKMIGGAITFRLTPIGSMRYCAELSHRCWCRDEKCSICDAHPKVQRHDTPCMRRSP